MGAWLIRNKKSGVVHHGMREKAAELIVVYTKCGIRFGQPAYQLDGPFASFQYKQVDGDVQHRITCKRCKAA